MTGTVTVDERAALRRARLLAHAHRRFRHTEAIAAGHAAIQAMGAAQNFNVTLTEDQTQFTDATCARTRSWCSSTPRAGQPERRAADGVRALDPARRRHRRHPLGGEHGQRLEVVRRHDRRRVLRATTPPARSSSRPRRSTVEDPTHPAMRAFPPTGCARTSGTTSSPSRAARCTCSPRSTRAPTSSRTAATGSTTTTRSPGARTTTADGTSTPRSATTARYWNEPLYRSHIHGAIEWASGAARRRLRPAARGPADRRVVRQGHARRQHREPDGDRGRARSRRLLRRARRHASSTTTRRPATSARSGRSRSTAATRTACSGSRSTRTSPTNRWLYLFYSAPTPEEQHVSRFTLAANGNIDMASEQVLLRIPHQRIVCCHSSGSLTFGPDGNLYISTGDDTEHAASQGYNPADDARAQQHPGEPNADANHAYDSRRTAGNTNDLRGKILRITPEPDGTYTIPPGNLFQPFRATRPRPGPRSTRWATGTRSGSRSTPRPAGCTTARSARTPRTRTRTAARAATTRSTRSARPATWAGRTASPTTSPTASGRTRAARPAPSSTARPAR